MKRYLMRYSDGKEVLKEFKDETEAQWFIHNEGDHLLEVTPYVDEQYDHRTTKSQTLLG